MSRASEVHQPLFYVWEPGQSLHVANQPLEQGQTESSRKGKAFNINISVGSFLVAILLPGTVRSLQSSCSSISQVHQGTDQHNVNIMTTEPQELGSL